MAKFKQAAKKTSRARTRPATSAADAEHAERLSKTLSESAQQIWLAGVGAFGRAQAEGAKLFDALVREGLSFEQTARKLAGGRADVVRDAVESKVGHARERAADTWDRLEKVFEDRVQRALLKLGVPGREDLAELSARVESLTAELRRQQPRAAKAPVRKAAKGPATRAPAKPTARRRSPAKSPG